MGKDKLSIKLNVANRNYPLVIKQEQEEVIRRATKEINDKVNSLKQKFPGNDYQDALAMATIQFVVKLLERNKNLSDENEFTNKISELNEDLEEYFEEENEK